MNEPKHVIKGCSYCGRPVNNGKDHRLCGSGTVAGSIVRTVRRANGIAERHGTSTTKVLKKAVRQYDARPQLKRW